MDDWRDIPLITQPYESADDVAVDIFNATIIDAVPVMVGDKVHLMKRPGLFSKLNLGTGAPVDGLYWFDKRRVALAVSAGRVFKITDASGSFVELVGSTDLLSNAPVKFSGDATRVLMANGGRMVHTDLSTLTTMADPDAPTAVTHIAMLDQYALANDGASGRILFSEINDLTNWQPLSFFSAESRPDDVVALDEGFREIIVLGRESVEFFVNDGQTPFSRIPGSAQPFGISATYSLALAGSTWMWLDHNRRFATMQGRQVINMSTPYDRVVQRYTAVDNAIGYTISTDGMPLYVLNFPTDQETLVFNYATQKWHRWGYWIPERSTYDRFRGQSYCYAKSWNLHLVGDHSNGIVYALDRQTYTDNGSSIRSVLRTGHITHGMLGDKQSDCVRLHCKRGVGNASAPDPQLMMRRRVNNRPQWGNERWKSLGRVGDCTPFIDWKANGVYRTCQYEFVHSDNSDLVIMGAQEQVTAIG